MTEIKSAERIPIWSMVGLVLVLVFNVAWRWHTIGATAVDRPFEGWLIRSGETEPLDCDEAAYAYMGRRVLRGDVLYRDLTENKPPLGYWLYTLAVAIGGANELTIRIMPIPYILATIALIWWIALKLGGPGSACLAALVFAVADTDPYVFGNGSNMEHFLNFFSVASLALMIRVRGRPSRVSLLLAGSCVGLAALVKQVAVTHGLVYALFLLVPSHDETIVGDLVETSRRTWRARLIDASLLALGFLAVWVIGLGIILAQGAGWAAYEDIIQFARAMATDLPSNPHDPPKLVRWITGNADPEGKLPWPFGTTTYYAWWGAGLWPLWLATFPATARLLRGGRARKLLAAWSVSAWLQILLPGMFWQHYYLLAVPGAALAVSLWIGDLLGSRRTASRLILVALIAALGWTLRIQARDYLGLTPNEITSRFKGGRQWVELRSLGRDLARRGTVWDDPHLFVWGWQSPLFIYSGMDGVTRHFFANELLKAHAEDNHPLVRPWIDEIVRDLKAHPPAVILAGNVPFPGLRRFLEERYLPSLLMPAAPDGRGLWVEKERYGEFHARSVRR